jgi:hypothetical protein
MSSESVVVVPETTRFNLAGLVVQRWLQSKVCPTCFGDLVCGSERMSWNRFVWSGGSSKVGVDGFRDIKEDLSRQECVVVS